MLIGIGTEVWEGNILDAHVGNILGCSQKFQRKRKILSKVKIKQTL